MANEFQVITTQEELDGVIGERLNRQKTQYEEKLKGYEDLKNDNARLQKELETKNQVIEQNKNDVLTKEKEFETLQSELNSLKLEQLKQKIAINNNIPLGLANRLTGDDEESLLQDAKTLSQFVNNTQVTQPLKSVEDPKLSDEDSAYRELLNNLEGE